jgi:two-component system phosphate regulon sensor histidine kinase PhoR
MDLLTLVLAIALCTAFGLAYHFWRRLRIATQAAEPPPSEPISPLVHAVASTFDSGLVVIDQERQVRYLNPQAEELLNIERSIAIGEGLITVVRDYQIDALAGDVLRDHEPREMVLQPPTGSRTLRVRATSLSESGEHGAVLLIRDVTQLNMLERARRDMVANVSHELRTPLASIKLLVETVQSSPPPHVAQRMLVQMAQEVDAVTQLVDELHELSQIESGRVALQLTPTSLASVTARALERIRPQAERKPLHISAFVSDKLPLVLIDAQRIGQVLLNLLHNAVKFTSPGGNVTIRAMVITIGPDAKNVGYVERRLEQRNIGQDRRLNIPPLALQGRPQVGMPQPLTPGDWMLVTVTDTGVGIPQRDLPRIFERFYKVDRARSRNGGGTGLGLAIAKHLIEGHGGRIWATSEEGVGSTFYFVLHVADDAYDEN